MPEAWQRDWFDTLLFYTETVKKRAVKDVVKVGIFSDQTVSDSSVHKDAQPLPPTIDADAASKNKHNRKAANISKKVKPVPTVDNADPTSKSYASFFKPVNNAADHDIKNHLDMKATKDKRGKKGKNVKHSFISINVKPVLTGLQENIISTIF